MLSEAKSVSGGAQKGFSKIWLIVIILVVVVAAAIAIYLWQKQKSAQESESASRSVEQESEPVEETRYFLALGDGFSLAAAMSPGMPYDNEDYSFSTGTQIKSVYLTLKDYGEELSVKNLAESSATSTDVLQNQVPKVTEYNPKFITLMIGAIDVIENDWGAWTDALETNIPKIIQQIKSEDRVIFIVNLPNFINMARENNPSCKQDPLGTSNMGLASISQVNQIIADVTEQNNLVLCDIHDVMGPEDCSTADCFHLNIEGQKKVVQQCIKEYTKQ